jgi:uncharacterized membrane protein YcaP (DUF421 family)
MHGDYLHFLFSIGVRTAVVLLWLTIGLRLLGKRYVGQMNVYDLVFIMCLANAVQNAMTAGKGELSVGLTSAAVLIGAGRILSEIFVRAPKLERRFVGTPTPLISDGRLIDRHMRRERVSEDELLAALRQHGLERPDQVKLAILEVDGTLSVVPMKDTGVPDKE